jgi:iron complex outermembrane receptor protein
MIAGLAIAAIPGLALAQATETPAAAAAAAPAAAAPADDTEELIVTGSRIRRTEFTSPSPIQVITSEQATLEGLVDTGTLLQQSSVAAGSFQVNSLLGGYVVEGGPGVNTISLRGLGATRTLVLLNGHRVGPAGARGTVGPVDLNTIPTSIIDRVEILKDGASTIYGSDAIAGVINIITKKNLDGGFLSAYYNAPVKSGGEQMRLSGAWGKTFERGYISVAGDYTKQGELTLGDRDETACAQDYVVDPSTGFRLDFKDPLTGQTKCNNVLTNSVQVAGFGGFFQYPVAGQTYPTAAQGNNTPFGNIGFVRAGRSGRLATQPYLNYDTPLYARISAISPSERMSLTVNGSFDITPKTEAYTEILINRRTSTQHGLQQLFPYVDGTNPVNPFVGASYALPIIAVASDNEQQVDYGRFLGGLRGTFGDVPLIRNWEWDIYGQFSHSKATYEADYVFNDRINATSGPGVACDPSQITVSPSVSCLTINWFSQRVLAGGFNDAERAFLFSRAKGETIYKQSLVEASTSGDIFKLPAGPVGLAIGASWRKDEIDDTPSKAEQLGNLYNQTAAGRTAGSDEVKEAFAELSVPLLKGLQTVDSLNMTASGRYTDYDSYGASSTYKYGLDWKINSAFRIRGTIGSSFRAPALYELYLANQTGFLNQNQIDPCLTYENSSNTRLQANCAAAGVPIGYTGGGGGATIYSGGGAGRLKAETAKTKTIGIIWTPSFLDFSLAIDYFDIAVSNEVTKYGAANILAQCYTSNQFPTDPFCSLFTRTVDRVNDDYSISQVQDNYSNVASQLNRGIDVTVRYQHQFEAGRLTLNGTYTAQQENGSKLLSDSEYKDYNGSTNNSDLVGQTQIKFDHGDWTYFWDYDFFSKTSDSGAPGALADVRGSLKYGELVARQVQYKQHVEFVGYHNMSIRKKMDNWTLQVGMQNVFDERAPALSTGGFRAGTAALNEYDLLGRRLFINIDRRF